MSPRRPCHCVRWPRISNERRPRESAGNSAKRKKRKRYAVMREPAPSSGRRDMAKEWRFGIRPRPTSSALSGEDARRCKLVNRPRRREAYEKRNKQIKRARECGARKKENVLTALLRHPSLTGEISFSFFFVIVAGSTLCRPLVLSFYSFLFHFYLLLSRFSVVRPVLGPRISFTFFFSRFHNRR